MRRSEGWGRPWGAIGALLISGCGGGGAALSPKLESAALCTGAWRALTAPAPWDVTSPLVYNDGTLYYTLFSTQTLMAQPASGDAPTAIAQAFTTELWGEGDHLLFTTGNLGNQIFSVPFAGGTPTLVLDGGAGRAAPDLAFRHAFTAADFYWTEWPTTTAPSPTTIWRQSRSGGTANQIGSFTFTVLGAPQRDTAEGIALTDDAVLVGDHFGSSGAVPFDGSAARPLAAPVTSAAGNTTTSLAGIDRSGAYWSFLSANDGFEVIRSPSDGGPAQLFWQSPTTEVSTMWPDGDGGWIAYGLEVFDDHVDHAVLWNLDAQGNARRLGCSPGPGHSFWIQVPGAVAPDAIYLITSDLDANTWEIDRIPR